TAKLLPCPGGHHETTRHSRRERFRGNACGRDPMVRNGGTGPGLTPNPLTQLGSPPDQATHRRKPRLTRKGDGRMRCGGLCDRRFPSNGAIEGLPKGTQPRKPGGGDEGEEDRAIRGAPGAGVTEETSPA